MARQDDLGQLDINWIIGSSAPTITPPPEPIRAPPSKPFQYFLSSCFARSSKTSPERSAPPPQSQSSAKPSPQNDFTNKPFRFFDLPSELRNMVYCFLLPHNIIISGHEKPVHKVWRQDLVLPSVSRRVREESCRMLYVDSIIHISLEDFSSYRAYLAWISTIKQADVAGIKELKIYAWMESNRTRNFVTCRNSCYHIRLKDDIHLADESLAKMLSSAVIPHMKYCWVSPKTHVCSRPDGEVCSLGMFQTLLDELDWDHSRFRVADIKAMVNGLFQYSSLHNEAQPRRDSDHWHLLDSPAEVSLINSFASPLGSYLGTQ